MVDKDCDEEDEEKNNHNNKVSNHSLEVMLAIVKEVEEVVVDVEMMLPMKKKLLSYVDNVYVNLHNDQGYDHAQPRVPNNMLPRKSLDLEPCCHRVQ